MNLEKQLKHYRLNQEEYQQICELMKREPKGVELALFSALWSEHCSYKSSRVHLKKLFNKSKEVLEAFGENAGVIDLGQGERIAFKMESHNHPSFIEPYQGAATGVGGILRDIFTMGARPIASANYLCFGEAHAARMETLVDGVVRGIGGYGNCVGVPTVTGQTEFHKSYNSNILVNAMAVGLFRPGQKIFTSKASGPGNWVVYVGAKTGRDGVHGASMASESFSEDSEAKRPNVQIGDPFFEKLLIESCLEVMAEDLVVAIQDMGAAGLTSSSFEMASKGGVGFDIHLDKVPIRDLSISPEEILLSESQERMLLVCEPKKYPRIKEIFHRWGLDATPIGEVQSEKMVQLFWKGECLTSIDPDLLVENAPQYQRPFRAWKELNRVKNECELSFTEKPVEEQLRNILSSVEGCSRRWIYRQYDQRVGGSTVQDSSHHVAVMRLPDSGRGLGIALGARPYLMRMDAKQGALDAVALPALELACKGFRPLAVTDCLNFGNPEKETVMSEFVASLEAMNEMCRCLKTPIISGNVSFYNETLGENITPTPSIGMIGLRASVENIPSDTFIKGQEKIYLLSSTQLITGGALQDQMTAGALAMGDLSPTEVARLIEQLLLLEAKRLFSSAVVIGKFGLLYQIARMTMEGIGATLQQLTEKELFIEKLYQVLVTIPENKESEFIKFTAESEFEVACIGVTGGNELVITDKCKCSLKEIKETYENGWRGNFKLLA